MRCNTVGGRTVGCQQVCGLGMERGTARWRELSEQRLTDDRMHERQGPSGGHEIGRTQCVRGHLGTLALKSAEMRCVAQRGAWPKHSDRLSEPLAISADPRE